MDNGEMLKQKKANEQVLSRESSLNQDVVYANAQQNAELFKEGQAVKQSTFEIQNRKELEMESNRRRSIASILTQEAQAKEDSVEMQNVKNAYQNVTHIMEMRLKKGMSAANLLEYLKESVADAIRACRIYCDARHPRFQAGKMRKAAVEGTMQMLLEDMACIMTLETQLSLNQVDIEQMEGGQISDLLYHTREEMDEDLLRSQSRRHSEMEEDPIEKLTLVDFEKLLAASSKDKIAFQRGKLRILSGRVRAGDRDLSTEDNQLMLDHLTQLFIERVERSHPLSEAERINLRMQMKTNLGGNMLEIRGGAISVEGLRSMFAKVEHLTSEVDALLKGEVEQKEEHDLAIAKKLQETFPADLDGAALEAMTKKSAKGFILPAISKKEYRKLAADGMNGVKDDLLDVLRKVLKRSDDLRGGYDAGRDYSALLGDEELLGTLTQLVIARKLAVTREGREAIEYQLNNYLSQVIRTSLQKDAGVGAEPAQGQAAEEQVQRKEEAPKLQVQEKELVIDNAEPQIPMEQVNAALSKFSGEKRQIAEMLLLQRKPSTLIKKAGDKNANALAAIYYAMRDLQNGFAYTEVKLGSTRLRFATRGDGGDICVKIGKEELVLPCPAAFYANAIEMDVSKNVAKYGNDVAGDLFAEKFDGRLYDFDENSRALLSNILATQCGIAEGDMANIPSERLARYATDFLQGKLAQQDLQEIVESWKGATELQATTTEALEMMKCYEEQKKREQEQGGAPKVVIIPKEKKADGPAWNEDEQKLVNLIGALISAQDEWKTEFTGKKQEPGEHVRGVLYAHADILSKILADYDFYKSTMKKYQIPGLDSQEIMNALDLAFDLFRVDEKGWKEKDDEEAAKEAEEAKKKAQEKAEGTSFFGGMFANAGEMLKNSAKAAAKAAEEKRRNALRSLKGMKEEDRIKALQFLLGGKEKDASWVEKLVDKETLSNLNIYKSTINAAVIIGESKLTKMTSDTVGVIQSMVSEAIKGMFDQKKSDALQGDDEEDTDTLKAMLTNNYRGEQGQGKFLKLVMNNYFKSMSPIDQRMMLASALRSVGPADVEAEAKLSAKEKEALEKERMSSLVANILKGAGPLMHKMLQGLPTGGMDPTFREAIDSMKSKLSPIPAEYVEARMARMVSDSGGAITKLTVMRSLGAASIGQAFLCKVQGPKYAKGGEEVVIKLLRPDVRNHMMREKEFMLQMARQTDAEIIKDQDGKVIEEKPREGGMYKTYLGQLDSIEKELDLRVEAENVELGQVYNKGNASVKSMEVDKLIAPAADALALKKAEGETVDSYLSKVNDEYRDLVHVEGVHHDAGYKKSKRLHKMRDDLLKRHKFLIELSKRWVMEGIYKSGFYHGDLHAGNIMVTDQNATIIDFGNAMNVKKRKGPDAQLCIIHMMCAAHSSYGENFTKYFVKLMGKDSEAEQKRIYDQLYPVFNKVVCMPGDAGLRIAVALSEAQKLGYELPPEIHNFSQCEIRLQNTVEDVKSQIEELSREIAVTDRQMKGEVRADANTDPFAKMMAEVKKDYLKSRQGKKEEDALKDAKAYVHGKFNNGSKPFDEKEVGHMISSSVLKAGFGKVTKILQVAFKLNTLPADIVGLVNHIREMRAIDDGSEAFRVTIQGLERGLNRNIDEAVKGLKELGAEEAALKQIADEAKQYLHTKPYVKEEFQGFVNRLMQVKLSDEYGDFLVRGQEYFVLNAENKPEQAGKRKELMTGLLADSKRLYESETRRSEADKVRERLILSLTKGEKVPVDQRTFEQHMQFWFEDKENHGEELAASYQNLKDLVAKKQELTADTEEVKHFMDLLEEAMVGRVLEIERQAKEDAKGTYDDIPDFMSVMGEIAMENIVKTMTMLKGDANKYGTANETEITKERTRKQTEVLTKRMDAASFVLEEVGMADYIAETYHKVFVPYRSYLEQPSKSGEMAVKNAIGENLGRLIQLKETEGYKELQRRFPRKAKQLEQSLTILTNRLTANLNSLQPDVMALAARGLNEEILLHNMGIIGDLDSVLTKKAGQNQPTADETAVKQAATKKESLVPKRSLAKYVYANELVETQAYLERKAKEKSK